MFTLEIIQQYSTYEDRFKSFQMGWPHLFLAPEDVCQLYLALVLDSADDCGHESVVRLLLERQDVDPNSKEVDGLMALMTAANEGHYQLKSNTICPHKVINENKLINLLV